MKSAAALALAAVVALAPATWAVTFGFNTTVTDGVVSVVVGSPSITSSPGPSGAWGKGTGDFDFKLYGPNGPQTVNNGSTVMLSFDARFTNLQSDWWMAIAFHDANWDKPWVQFRWLQNGDAANDGNWHHYSAPFTLSTTRVGAGADEFGTTDFMLWSIHQPGKIFNGEIDNFLLTDLEGNHFTGMNTSFDNGDPSGAATYGRPEAGYSANSGQPFTVVPEPASLALLGLAGLGLLARRR